MSVAVVIPCYNHAQTLRRAVDSVLRQRGVSQIIVVDDCSVDDSFEVAECLMGIGLNIQLIRNDVNSGPAASRNHGVELVEASHLTFLDADDELAADFLGVALDALADNPSLKAIKCEMGFFDPVKGHILPFHDPRYIPTVLSSACGVVLEAEVFRALGGFSLNPIFRGPAGGEDVAFMQALLKCLGPLAKIDTEGYKVWSRSGSHVDQFLSSTRLLENGGFEFLNLTPDQAPGGRLAQALEAHIAYAVDRFQRVYSLADQA